MKSKIRYEKLGYVELNVSDLVRSRDFYQSISGRQFVAKGPMGELNFRCCYEPYTVVLHQGKAHGHKHTGLMREDNKQSEHLFVRLSFAVIPYESLSKAEFVDRSFARAVQTIDPNFGAVVEFFLGTDDRPCAFTPTLARIQRLEHLAWGTNKFDGSIAHFHDVLNLEPFDYVEGVSGVFRCWRNPWHHGVAVGWSPSPAYSHTIFMMSEIDDIWRAIHRLNRASVPVASDPGRHLASGSTFLYFLYFLYFLNSDGLSCEYSFAMEQFPEGRHAIRANLNSGRKSLISGNHCSITVPAFDPVWADIVAHYLAVWVHWLHPANTERLFGPGMMVNVIGISQDAALAITSFITTDILSHPPGLKLGFSHGGGRFGALLDRMDYVRCKYPSVRKTSSISPRKCVRQFCFDTVDLQRALPKLPDRRIRRRLSALWHLWPNHRCTRRLRGLRYEGLCRIGSIDCKIALRQLAEFI
ncbi:MAG: VOC family protein [Gallionella sp.]|nr:VOC family protein [Gallionella sp.]